jgi:hypothetical protein
MKIFRTTIALLTLALAVSCNSGNEKKSETSSASNSLAEVMKAADAISPEIMNVEDVFLTLELVDAGYYPILCNDPYSATSYLSSKPVAAANLGVYITDIVYHMYGEATSDMFITFSASQELAKYIGLEAEFAATILTELEGGGDISRDSLIYVFNGLMETSKKYGSENEMAFVHTSFLTGITIEKLFISSSLLDQAYNKEEKSEEDVVNAKKLLVVFQTQLKAVDALIESLDGQLSHVENLIVSTEMEDLKESAAALDGEIKEILDAEELKPSEHVAAIHKQLTTIRNRIVSAS